MSQDLEVKNIPWIRVCETEYKTTKLEIKRCEFSYMDDYTLV